MSILEIPVGNLGEEKRERSYREYSRIITANSIDLEKIENISCRDSWYRHFENSRIYPKGIPDTNT